jgi:predicted nucleic acid-binding Zn ribbon protein
MCGKVVSGHKVYCSEQCKTKAHNQMRKAERFDKGKIWVLDMNSWVWELEERGGEIKK